MVIKFRSSATADIIMRHADGERLLRTIGKAATAMGIITAEQIPQSIHALEAAIQAEALERESQHIGPTQTCNDELEGERVSRRQHYTPLLEMLRESALSNDEVIWVFG